MLRVCAPIIRSAIDSGAAAYGGVLCNCRCLQPLTSRSRLSGGDAAGRWMYSGETLALTCGGQHATLAAPVVPLAANK